MWSVPSARSGRLRVIVCDTHALIFDALAPDRLGPEAAKSIEKSHRAGELACADISLWEIAMLMEKGRLQVDASMEEFITAMITARNITVLPITPAIAAVAASHRVPRGDPADRLIAGTAMVLGSALITKDRRLVGIPGLPTIW